MSAKVLLDWQADGRLVERLQGALLTQKSERIADLHLWAIGQGQYAAEVTIVSDHPCSPDHYKALIPADLGIVHVTVEVHRCGASQKAA